MFPTQETVTYADSKYVANILSTMASGGPATTIAYPMPNFLTSGTGATPTLTPTSLASLEQTFIELQSVTSRHDGAGNLGGHNTQSGFVPPVVGPPSSAEHSQDSYGSDSEWGEPVVKRPKTEGGVLVMAGDAGQSSPQRKYTRRSRNEKLSPEEDARRSVRRERNKLAAAKCRQRRVDHTNCLVEETEQLEAERSSLETEISALQQQRDQLEFLFKAHVPLCKVDPHAAAAFKVKAEPVDVAAKPHSAAHCGSHGASHLAYTSASTAAATSSSSSSVSSFSRPTSLALGGVGAGVERSGELPVVVSCAGVSLSTPSSGLFTYTSFDSLANGSTGFTPLTSGPGSLGSTGLTPLGSTGLTPLATGPPGLGSTGLTPLASGPGVSCASQLHRNGSDSSSEPVGSPTLVSL